MRPRIALLALVSFVAWGAASSSAYSTSGRQWPAGSSIVVELGQEASPGRLLDGSADWNAVTEAALALWNSSVHGVSFRVAHNSGAGSLRNGINNVIWADDMYGDEFGDAVAVTISLSRRNIAIETDVLFDRARNWNSYRGKLRRATAGGTLLDMRRVALHEFGHVLGLDHPDQHDQSVVAIMNSRVGAIDTLQADDVDGAQSIYGAPPAQSPPGAALPPPSRLSLCASTPSPHNCHEATGAVQ